MRWTNALKLEDSTGQPIASLEDWARLYDNHQTSHQWKKGRSAYSAAEFVLENDGLRLVSDRASETLHTPVTVDRAVPEYEVPFDEYGRGRVHDIGIVGRTAEGKSVFVGVEAKVDESFGATVLDTYLDAKARQICGISTNAPERMEKLLSRHFFEPTRAMFQVRYQLLYATIGTLAAGADHSILFVIVFRTNAYSEAKGAENFRDYAYFMESVNAVPLERPGAAALAHEIEFDGRPLQCRYEYFDL